MSNEGTTGTKADLIEHLTREHREVEQLWSQLQHAHDGGDDVQAELGRKIVAMLSKHDATELQVLYPALRGAVPDGDTMADHALSEHSKVRDQLTEVDGKDPVDETVFNRFQQILDAVQHHVQEEENELFPKLREHCSEQQLMELNEQLERMEPVAPTHPHPHTPESQIGATAAGMVAGVADKARDALKDEKG